MKILHLSLLFALTGLLILAVDGKRDKDGILEDDELDEYKAFAAKHKKGKGCEEGTTECKQRKGNFLKNLKKYKENKKRATFETQIGPFADWSDDEKKRILMSADEFEKHFPQKDKPKSIKKENNRKKRAIPSTYDWRTTGALNDIKNQAQCGDCWAFAAVAVIEAVDNMANCRLNASTRASYSEQQVTDCTYYNASLTTAQQRDGCQGGNSGAVLDYVVKNGITTAAAMPFVAQNGTTPKLCPSTVNPRKTPLRDWMDLSRDVPSMMNFIATTAPIVVAIWMCDDLFDYKNGVYDGSTNSSVNCGGHAVAAIGYGTYTNGVPYWLVRNQWDTTWGMSGYGMIKRGVDLMTIESRGVVGPIPTVAASSCTTNTPSNTAYPVCTCTAPSTQMPTAPYATQTTAGVTGCTPSNWVFDCPGSGNDAVQFNLYDDTGKTIVNIYTCWNYNIPKMFGSGKCQTMSPSGNTINYPTFNGSRIAYHYCQNTGPNSACGSAVSTTTTTTKVTTTTTKATTTTTKATTTTTKSTATGCQKCAQNLTVYKDSYDGWTWGTYNFTYSIDATKGNCLVADWYCKVPDAVPAAFELYYGTDYYDLLYSYVLTQQSYVNGQLVSSTPVNPSGRNDITDHSSYSPFLCNANGQWSFNGVTDFVFDCHE